MIPGGKSGPSLVAVSALNVPAKIKPFPTSLNFTSGPSITDAHRPYIIIVPVQSTAVRALAKGATWNSVQDVVFSGVRV